MVEHRTLNPQAEGSSPSALTATAASSRSGRSLLVLAFLAVLTFVGCRSTEPTASAEPWTRAQWLEAAEEVAADPLASRAKLDKLLSTDAWRKLDRSTLATNGDVMRFYPAFKKLTMALASRGAVNDVIALGLYTLDVYPGIFVAGADFIAQQPPDARAKRVAGLDKMRFAMAIEICAMLQMGTVASDDTRRNMIAKLSEPASYGEHTTEGLQLILATIDEQLAHAPYQAIRDVIAREHAQRPRSHTTYQGVATTTRTATRTLVSRTGGFSVEIGQAALAKRVEVAQADGTMAVQHWITLLDGQTTFEAACFDGTTESDLAAHFGATPNVRPTPEAPGRFAMQANGREARIRILTIGTRGCIVSAEGPSVDFPSARADAFVRSIKPSR